jgi:iron complex outermembrane recepter protein
MRNISSRAGLLSGCLGVSLIVAALRVYADNDVVAPEAAGTPGGLEEIVVTARRRQETLQDVPESVTAFTQQALTDRSITSSFDLNKVVPGLTVYADSGNPALPDFSIRGRGQNYGAAASVS